MRTNHKTRWLSVLLAFMLVLTCATPALAEQAAPAQPEQTEPAGAHSIVKKTKFNKNLTTEQIVAFYQGVKYATWDNGTIKKKLHPAFNIGADNGIQESMIQCVLSMKRIDGLAQGLRWFDIKRYGIEIWRRTMEADPHATSDGPTLRPATYKGVQDVLTVDDPRRAMQLPQDVISAGMTPNPRVTDAPQDMSLKPREIPVSTL